MTILKPKIKSIIPVFGKNDCKNGKIDGGLDAIIKLLSNRLKIAILFNIEKASGVCKSTYATILLNKILKIFLKPFINA
ncbi:MAG: hypothetical protein ACTSRG_17165 [Candidatus Helarchaeota archaeon]